MIENDTNAPNNTESGETPANWGEAIACVILGVLLSLSCFYLDKARGAAFVIVPGITLYQVLKALGVSRKRSPKLAYTAYSLFFVYAVAFEWWLISNPIPR